MEDIDRKAWKILSKRAVKSLCYLVGMAVLGYVAFYVASAIQESQYFHIFVVIGLISAFSLSLFVILLAWKDRIKEELLVESEEILE